MFISTGILQPGRLLASAARPFACIRAFSGNQKAVRVLRARAISLGLVLVFMLCAGARAQSPPAFSAFQYQGLTISEVRFETVTPQDEPLLRSLLPIKPGDKFDRTALRNAIQTLYDTGKFYTVDANAEKRPDGTLMLTFSTKPNYFYGFIGATGSPQPPTPNQLTNATKLDLGELFVRSDVDSGMDRMKRVMSENGYYQSKIQPQFSFHPETQQADVDFQITSGARARVGAVSVQGESGFSPAEISEISKLHHGDKVSTSSTNKALDRLRKKYQKQGRLEAQVAITERVYHPDSNTLDYTLSADRGPKIDIHVEGASVRSGLLKKLIPVFEENAVDDDLLNEGSRNLRHYFQSKGYFDTRVSYTRREDAAQQHMTIVYDVKKGIQHKLVNVQLVGNKYFDRETIRERMQLQPARFLLAYGLFSQDMLNYDVQAITALYQNNGFAQVKVTPQLNDNYRGKRGDMQVAITIQEGPQTLVRNFNIAGNTVFPEDELRGQVNLSEGQPFSDSSAASDRDSLLDYYFNRGFPNVQVEAVAVPSPEAPDRMDLVYKVMEGQRTYVDQVIISGLVHTRDYVVRDQVQLHSGEPLSRLAMLDTQRRLYDLGIFNEVNVAVQNPNGNIVKKSVLLQLDEANRYTFDYGFGFEVQTGNPSNNCTISTNCSPQGRTGASPRVSFEVNRLNFLGRNHTLVFKARYGRLQQRGLFSYEVPRFRNHENLKTTFTAFYDKTQDVRTFTAQRLEGSAQLQQQVNKGTMLEYRFTYRKVKVDPNTLKVTPDQIPLLSRPVRVGMPSFTYVRDTRDDPTETRRGAQTTADFGVASGIFGSESSFTRLLAQNSTYHHFGRNKWIFARELRIGIEQPYGQSTFVPLPERFFAGGSTNLRAFAINQAGPRDPQTGFPLGGEAMFVNQFELRSPPLALPYVGQNLSTVFFHDMGNVFTSASDIFPSMIRVHQPDAASCKTLDPNAKCSFNYFVHALGIGLRYRTPIGPVRVDLSYTPNPPTFPIRLSDNPHVETLSHFNFFFSIGQTF